MKRTSILIATCIGFIMASCTNTSEAPFVDAVLYGALLGIICYLYMKFAKWDRRSI